MPRWQSMARHAFHVRKVALYFLALLVLHLVWKLSAGEPPLDALGGALWLAALAALAVGLLALLAWAMSRASLYTITSRRVVMRFGVAIPISVNLPFAQITKAALRAHGDGTGDIPLTMSGPVRAPYIVFWPHARPWHFSPPQPMLRAVPDAAKVAGILASALEAARADAAQADGGVNASGQDGAEAGSATGTTGSAGAERSDLSLPSDATARPVASIEPSAGAALP
jgi:hypothetical protein